MGPEQKYGALARDGISCTVCHHIAATDLGEERRYHRQLCHRPGERDLRSVRDATIIPKPMEHALGITPSSADQIASSDLCGSCHNILLPVFDNAGTPPDGKLRADHPPRVDQQRLCSRPIEFPVVPRLPHADPFKGQRSPSRSPTSNRAPSRQPRTDYRMTRSPSPRGPLLAPLPSRLERVPERDVPAVPADPGARQIDYMTGTATVPPSSPRATRCWTWHSTRPRAWTSRLLEKTADGNLRMPC